MTPGGHRSAWISLLCRGHAFLLGGYPKVFRDQFGREMQQVFRDGCRAAAASHDLLRFAGLMLWDWLRSCARERLASPRGFEIGAERTFKGWWLLVLCGVLDSMNAGMNLLMLGYGSPSSRLYRFASLNTVWDMSVLALVAGACAIAAGLWNSGRLGSWLLALHGLGLIAFGSIGVSPLVRGPLSFRPVSLLFVLMSISAGAAGLGTAHRLRSGARDRWLLNVAGAASLGFACSFPAVAFGLVRLQPPNSYWIWMSSYFWVTALCLWSMAVSLHASEPPQTASLGIGPSLAP